MAWEVEYTDQFREWWDDLGEEEQEAVTAAVGVLERRGPVLGRPLVDTITQSRHSNMKELIPPPATSAFSLPSTPAEPRSSSSAATRAASGTPGTTGWSRSPTISSTSIFASSNRK